MNSSEQRLRELRMRWALQDHPELAAAMRAADHWVDADGHVQIRFYVEDLAAMRPALAAWAAARGVVFEERSAGEPAEPIPPGEPLTMHEAAARVAEFLTREAP